MENEIMNEEIMNTTEVLTRTNSSTGSNGIGKILGILGLGAAAGVGIYKLIKRKSKKKMYTVPKECSENECSEDEE